MKTLTLETSKRLQEAWIFKEIKTEYIYNEWGAIEENIWNDIEILEYRCIKTLTLEEAIELLPSYLDDRYYWLLIRKTNTKREKYVVQYVNQFTNDSLVSEVSSETLLQSVENMINYLLDNNLLEW